MSTPTKKMADSQKGGRVRLTPRQSFLKMMDIDMDEDIQVDVAGLSASRSASPEYSPPYAGVSNSPAASSLQHHSPNAATENRPIEPINPNVGLRVPTSAPTSSRIPGWRQTQSQSEPDFQRNKRARLQSPSQNLPTQRQEPKQKQSFDISAQRKTSHRGNVTRDKIGADAELLERVLEKNNKLGDSYDSEVKKTKALQLQLVEEKNFSKELQEKYRKLEREFTSLEENITTKRSEQANALANTQAQDPETVKKLKDEILALKEQASQTAHRYQEVMQARKAEFVAKFNELVDDYEQLVEENNQLMAEKESWKVKEGQLVKERDSSDFRFFIMVANNNRLRREGLLRD